MSQLGLYKPIQHWHLNRDLRLSKLGASRGFLGLGVGVNGFKGPIKDIKFGPRYVFGLANYGFFRRLLCWLELAGLCSKR